MKDYQKYKFYFALLIIVSAFVVAFIVIDFELSSIDSDGDGVVDDQDAFPSNKYETNDTDHDGIGDNADAFPLDPSASIDSDGDGYPDYFNNGKTSSDSTSIPALVVDIFPYNPNEWIDTDGDGIGDNSDAFPIDPDESQDTDGDGIGNNADANPYVDLSFSLLINRIKLIRNVDLLGWGQLYIRVTINDEESEVFDNDGAYWKVRKNSDCILPIELTYDIDDSDTSTSITTIEVTVYDADWIFQDDIVDINQDTSKNRLEIIIDHLNNSVNVNGVSEGNQAILWYDVILPESIIPEDETYNLSYQWSFYGRKYNLYLEIPVESYDWYENNPVNRSPQMRGSYAMKSFVTSNDDIIETLVDTLQTISNEENWDDIETSNFVLSFVQQNIRYSSDNLSKGVEEYWRYPVETLVEKQGDCEDSTILFATIMKKMGFQTVLLFYIIDDNIGHLASGISLNDDIMDGFSVSYESIDYYYCETTSQGFIVGEKPSDIPIEPEMIILI